MTHVKQTNENKTHLKKIQSIYILTMIYSFIKPSIDGIYFDLHTAFLHKIQNITPPVKLYHFTNVLCIN